MRKEYYCDYKVIIKFFYREDNIRKANTVKYEFRAPSNEVAIAQVEKFKEWYIDERTGEDIDFVNVCYKKGF